MDRYAQLTLSHPEDLPRQVKLSGVRQSKITKGAVLAGLGVTGLKPHSFTPMKVSQNFCMCSVYVQVFKISNL